MNATGPANEREERKFSHGMLKLLCREYPGRFPETKSQLAALAKFPAKKQGNRKGNTP